MEALAVAEELSIEESTGQGYEQFTFDECVKVAQMLRDRVEKCQWALGALADKVNRSWGEYAMRKFAADIGISRSYAYQLANCFCAFPDLSTRVDNFSFSHHRVAVLLADNPVIALREANPAWSVREFENYLNQKNEKEGKETGVSFAHNTLLDGEAKNRVAEIQSLCPEKTTNQIINESLKRIAANAVSVEITPELEADYRFLAEYLAEGSPQDVFVFSVRLAADYVRDKFSDPV